MLEGEEVVPRYKFALFFYYAKEHEDEKLDEKAHNFELHIHYVVEQEATTKGIEMSKGIELVFVTIILPKEKPTIAEVVLVDVKTRYSEPRIN